MLFRNTLKEAKLQTLLRKILVQTLFVLVPEYVLAIVQDI